MNADAIHIDQFNASAVPFQRGADLFINDFLDLQDLFDDGKGCEIILFRSRSSRSF